MLAIFLHNSTRNLPDCGNYKQLNENENLVDIKNNTTEDDPAIRRRIASYMPFSIDGITPYIDDCLNKIDSLPFIGCVVTSPPYNFNLRIHTGRYTKRSVKL